MVTEMLNQAEIDALRAEKSRQLDYALAAFTKPSQPGPHLYTDQPGHTERVEVVLVDGELHAVFEDMVDGDGPVPVADMAGTWSSV